jgi:branched-chain amino acid transport system ATP-binding protein
VTTGAGAGEPTGPAAPAVLEIDGVTAGYGAVTVLRTVSITVEQGSIVTLLGPNGAGKTTALRVASGFLRPRIGSVRIDGIEVTDRSPHAHARLGLCFVPEGKGVFRSLSVRENLRLSIPPWEKDARVSVALDAFPVLKKRLESRAGVLSGGEQQMLALARCYLARPKVILADELSMGLAPNLVDAVFASLSELAATGVSVLLVEQYINRALELADTAYLLDRGVISYAGPAADLNEDEVVSSYLGIQEVSTSADEPAPGEAPPQAE